jgi:pyrroloquinoline-quinone synthase
MTHAFAQALAPLHLLKHPFYQDWMAGTLSRETLKDYAGQYFTHVKAFPRYISAIHSRCESEAARKMLLENLNDEEGLSHGVSHPELWMRFAEGMGVERSKAYVTEPRAAIQAVVDTFFGFAQSSFHEGLGALYAYESQIPEIAQSKISGLIEHYQVSDARTLQFFEVHKTADIYHREAIEKIIDALPEKEKQEALAAAGKTARMLWQFLTDVHGHQVGLSSACAH